MSWYVASSSCPKSRTLTQSVPGGGPEVGGGTSVGDGRAVSMGRGVALGTAVPGPGVTGVGDGSSGSNSQKKMIASRNSGSGCVRYQSRKHAHNASCVSGMWTHFGAEI